MAEAVKDPEAILGGALGAMVRAHVVDALRAELRPLVERLDALAAVAPPRFVSVAQAARILGRSVWTVRRAAERGEIAVRRVGRGWSIDAAALRPASTERIAQLAAEARR